MHNNLGQNAGTLYRGKICSPQYNLQEKQVYKIENAGSKYLRGYFFQKYGINNKAKILEAPDNVTKQPPRDIMRVFLEGILSYELKFLFKYLLPLNMDLDIDEDTSPTIPKATTSCKNVETLPRKSDLSFFKSLLVTGL